MCMENPTRITSDKVPKYGWKVLHKHSVAKTYSTPYWHQKVDLDTWIKAPNHKDKFSRLILRYASEKLSKEKRIEILKK